MGHSVAGNSAQLANAVRETALGIPFVVRSEPKLLLASNASLEFAACAFLIAQGPYCAIFLSISPLCCSDLLHSYSCCSVFTSTPAGYFGASTGWLDAEWVHRRSPARLMLWFAYLTSTY